MEEQLDGKADVVRLNILSQVGRQAAARYGVRGVPTLLVVDGQGQVAYGQYGIPFPATIVSQVDTLLAAR